MLPSTPPTALRESPSVALRTATSLSTRCDFPSRQLYGTSGNVPSASPCQLALERWSVHGRVARDSSQQALALRHRRE